MIEKDQGFLIIDDTTLDKPYSNQVDLVSYYWSGKHHRVVKGISLVMSGRMGRLSFLWISECMTVNTIKKPRMIIFRKCWIKRKNAD